MNENMEHRKRAMAECISRPAKYMLRETTKQAIGIGIILLLLLLFTLLLYK